MKQKFLAISLMSFFSIHLMAQAYISDDERDYIKQSKSNSEILIPETGVENRNRGYDLLNRRIKWNKIKELRTEEDTDSTKYVDSFFFYFKKNQDDFVDERQVTQIKSILDILSNNPTLIAKVMGAADSVTGNEADNRLLAIRRAKRILQYIKDAGILKTRLRAFSLGGIDNFPKEEDNRMVCVILYRI